MTILKNIATLSISACFMISSAYAANHPTPHTWHTVTAKTGQWQAKLQMLNEEGYFVDETGADIKSFSVTPLASKVYGFGFKPGSDFDIAYTLTLIEDSAEPSMSSKACIYLITAKGPANPDIRPSSFNGATCEWNVVPGRGENFTVS